MPGTHRHTISICGLNKCMHPEYQVLQNILSNCLQPLQMRPWRLREDKQICPRMHSCQVGKLGCSPTPEPGSFSYTSPLGMLL